EHSRRCGCAIAARRARFGGPFRGPFIIMLPSLRGGARINAGGGLHGADSYCGCTRFALVRFSWTEDKRTTIAGLAFGWTFMPDRFNIPQDAYFNWPEFERQLTLVLSERLDADAVERVMAKTLRAYNTLQLPSLSASLPGDAARALRREIIDQDNRALRSKTLNILIESFIAVETSRGRSRDALGRV